MTIRELAALLDFEIIKGNGESKVALVDHEWGDLGGVERIGYQGNLLVLESNRDSNIAFYPQDLQNIWVVKRC